MFKVRAEITGEFVTVEKFNTFEEALKYADDRTNDGIYDSVEMWEI